MSGFYGVRRSFLSDSDFHSTKQFPSDACSSSVAKAFPCEPSAGPSHPALLDPYFPEPYGDHRPSALTPSPGSLFNASPLPPLLPPPFPGDPAHLVLVSEPASASGGRPKVGVLPQTSPGSCTPRLKCLSLTTQPGALPKDPCPAVQPEGPGGWRESRGPAGAALTPWLSPKP